MKLNFKESGTGKPVFILHGLFGSSDNWSTFAKRLSEKGFRVITVDLRNHGLSPHSDEFSFDAMAEDIHELMMELHLEQIVIEGHSLGGKTAMKFAIKHPEAVSSLVVIDIAPRFYSVHHRTILDTLLKVDTNNLKSRSEAEEIVAAGIDDLGTRQFLLKNLYWKDKEHLEWRFNLQAINKYIENVGEKTLPENPFGKPTLFIKGEHSNYISYEDEREIFDHFSNVEIKTAPGSGHWVHADNPEWLLNTLTDFLIANAG